MMRISLKGINRSLTWTGMLSRARKIEWKLDLSNCRCVSVGFFFFQAEDGIRDYKVTGVQTCALPICQMVHHRIIFDEFLAVRVPGREKFPCLLANFLLGVPQQALLMNRAELGGGNPQIGRASCRERV